MTRRTFFSFHYKPDVNRAMVVRNSWLTQTDRESSGFFDSSVFESRKRTSDEALKQFLIDGLKGTSVTCVLVGAETYSRPWVQFELFRSFYRGNGILAIEIAGVSSFGKVSTQGPNPLGSIAFEVKDSVVTWKRKSGSEWKAYTEVPKMNLSDVAYDLGTRRNHTFSTIFPIYDWKADDGYNNLGRWIETAAQRAGK